MAYPPGPSRAAAAEEYELPIAGPSNYQTSSSTSINNATPSKSHFKKGRQSSHNRTITIPSNDATAALLFSAPKSASSTNTSPVRPTHPNHSRSDEINKVRHRRTISITSSTPGSPKKNAWANFLDDDGHQVHQNGGLGLEGLVGGGTGEGGGGSGRVEQVHVPDFGHMLGLMPEEIDHYEVARSIEPYWKRRLYLLMEEPRSGREAFYVHLFVTGSILFSSVLTTLSTLPTFHLNPTSISTLFGLDTTLIVLFTAEYLARSLAHSSSWSMYWKWATSFFPILDLLAILPYYIEVAREEDTSILFRFSILRTFRLLRVFRAFKYQNQMLLTIEVMYVAVRRSKDALVAISFFIILVLVLFSTLIYFAERGTWDVNAGAFLDNDGDPSQFDSIPQTAWFALVTMSTVGYGDVVPRSPLGKFLTMPLLLFGLLLIALPSFVLGRNFAIVFDAMTNQINQNPSTVNPTPRESFELQNPPSPMPQLPPSLHSTSNQNQPLLNSTPKLSDPENMSLPPYHSYPSKPQSTSNRASPNPSSITHPSQPIFQTDHYPSHPNIRVSNQGTPTLDLPAAKNDQVFYDEATVSGRSTPNPSAQMSDRGKDLSNVKLAKNQIVLLEEIRSMRKTIDKQSEMISSLLRLLEEKQTIREVPNINDGQRHDHSVASGTRDQESGSD